MVKGEGARGRAHRAAAREGCNVVWVNELRVRENVPPQQQARRASRAARAPLRSVLRDVAASSAARANALGTFQEHTKHVATST